MLYEAIRSPQKWSELGEHYKDHWRGYVRQVVLAGAIRLVEVPVGDEPIEGQTTIDDYL